MIPPYLTCREWRELRVGDNGLTEIQAERLHAAAKLASRRLKLPKSAVLTRTHRGLRAGQIVGILITPSRALEILPKIDGDAGAEEDIGAVRSALIRMLAVAWQLKVADGELAALDSNGTTCLNFSSGCLPTGCLRPFAADCAQVYNSRGGSKAVARLAGRGASIHTFGGSARSSRVPFR